MAQQTFEITAPNGKTLEVSGDRMPTEAELHQIFKEAGVASGADFSRVTSGASTSAAPEAAGPTVLDHANDVVRGAVKGVGNTVFGLGKAVHDYTPIGRISDAIQPGAFAQRPPEIVPSNTGERVGYGAEQLAEFFVPTGAAGAIAKLGNAPRTIKAGVAAAQAAGLTLAQTGSPTAAGVSGAITAAIPGVGAALGGVSGALKAGANKTMAQALGATKEWAKDEAGRLAPQMLQRGLGGSRAAMLAKASEKVADLGSQITQEVAAASAAGATVPGVAFVNTIANSRQTITMIDAAGKTRAIPGQELAVKKLDDLAEFVMAQGRDIPLDKAHTLKVAWDQIVSKAGLYGQKAMASSSDNAKAWAFREASSAMRKLIAAESPTVAALNKEFRFFKGLENVLTATEKRTQAQGSGLVSGITGAAGAAAGFASGDSFGDRVQNAVFGGLVGKQLVRVVQSPAFRTRVAAPLKDKLADALATGQPAPVMHTLTKILSSLPGQFTPALAQGK